MQALVLDIPGETSTDDLLLVFDLQVDGANFPQDSAFSIFADFIDNPATKINVVGGIALNLISFSVPRAQSLPSGIWNYRVREVMAGGRHRTPVRGKLDLKIVPQPV